MVRDGVLIFNSVHKVMRVEKILKEAGFDVRIMPVPRQLSSDCGLSIAFKVEDERPIRESLEGNGFAAEGVYRTDGDAFVKI